MSETKVRTKEERQAATEKCEFTLDKKSRPGDFIKGGGGTSQPKIAVTPKYYYRVVSILEECRDYNICKCEPYDSEPKDGTQ